MFLARAAQPFIKAPWRHPHPCPSCGRTMQLTRSTAHTGGISEFRSFGCGECGLWTTDLDDGGEEAH